ncbi:MAG: ABC-2 transporter permease [Defluviitaleaceae bacterium]|nr:ABC-2 transporter permease [Defluviitaleaceae bacterium]
MSNTKKIIRFIKSDFFAISPRVVAVGGIVFMVFLAMGYNFAGILGASIGVVTTGSRLASLPFSAGDKNGLDKLYAMLCIERKTIVFGRYIFLIIFSILASITYFLFAVIVRNILNHGVSIVEIVAVTMFASFISMIISIIEFPLFFKFGFKKLMLLNSLIPSVVMLIVIFALRPTNENDISTVPLYSLINFVELLFLNVSSFVTQIIITILLFVLFLTIPFLISLFLSLKIYNKRDF